MANTRLNTAPLVIASPAIEHRRPGIGSLLMRLGAVGSVGLPLLLLLVPIFWPPGSGAYSPILGVFVLFIVFLMLIAPLVAIAGVIVAAISFPLSFRGELRAEDTGLVITRDQREVRFGKERFDGGILLPGGFPSGKHPKVALHLKGGNVIHAEVDDATMAYRLLDRLEIEPAKRRVTIALASPVRQLFAGCLSLPISIVFFAMPLGYLVSRNQPPQWPVVGYAFCVFLSMLVVMRIARPTEVSIGNDGLRIRTPLRDEWIPYDRVRSVEARANALFVEQGGPGTNSRRNRIATGSADLMLALANRIRMAMALGSNGDGDTTAGQKLDPQGKTLEAWKKDLQFLVTSIGYRKAGITPDALLSLVEDPDLPLGQRLGAAVALRIVEHPEARERIRIAADACADEDMKRAFDEIATGELSERVFRRAVE